MMKKTIMALALALLPVGMATAQVQLLVVPKDGLATKRINLDDIKYIEFPAPGEAFSIETADLRWSYSYDFVRSLKFDGLVNAVSAVNQQDNPLQITYKQGQIFVSGMGDAVTHAVILDLNGCSRVSLPHFDGQPIDVSALPKGAYILRIGGQAFKFLR